MGEVFAGRYELLDLIGQGGMGSVWRVHDRREDRVVAAKVLRQSDAASLLRFVRETAFRVQHPHVVTPLGWTGEDDRVLFTMPVVEGGSVATLVGDHGPLPAPFVAEVLRQLLDGLAAVHASRIVHRDVKPANVLLAATGSDRPHAYLTDFGIAVELDGPRLTETNVAIGTRGYMAPEQRRGELTTASDLYAVGALARFMLTALPPDAGPEAVGPGDTAGAAPPEEVPETLWALTTDLLQVEPARRPDAAAAAARLAVPELAWRPGGAGEVEVLRQVVGDGGDVTEPLDAPTTVQEQGAVPPAGVGGADVPDGEPDEPEGDDGAGEARGAGDPSRVSPARRVGIAALALAGIIALVLVWSPWSGESPGTDDTATSEASTHTSGEESGPPGGTSSTSPSPQSTSTSGSVEVGTVVTRVGQPCRFSDVGLRETTSGGVEVECRLGEDGAYSWERADS